MEEFQADSHLYVCCEARNHIWKKLYFTLVKKLVPGEATGWVGCVIRFISFASFVVGGSSKEEFISHAAPHVTNFSALSYRLTCYSGKVC